MSLASRMNIGCQGIGRCGTMCTPRTTTVPPGGGDELGAAGEGLLTARRLDVDVVEIVGADLAVEAFDGLAGTFQTVAMPSESPRLHTPGCTPLCTRSGATR